MDIIQPGDVVQLRSGSPNMTVVNANDGFATLVYYNTLNGIICSVSTRVETLRHATERPINPADQAQLRNTGVLAKSSLS